MEHCTDRTSISGDQKCAASGKRTVPSHTRQGSNLRDMLMSDDPNFSYVDFHHETARSQNTPGQVHSQQSPVLEKTTPKKDELVRYMSKLPSYLEKGKNLQEQPLNVGVLDWKRLENWRHNKEQTTHKHNGCSQSSSNTSLFSTDESSTHSSRDFDVSRGNAGKFPVSKYLLEKGCQTVFDNSVVAEKTKNERNRSRKETLRSQETKLNTAHRDCSRREESGVVIPRNWSENSCTGVTTLTYFTANDRLLVEPGPRNISRKHNCEESVTNPSQTSKTLVQTSKIFHDTSMTFPKEGKAPYQASQTFPCPARKLCSPSREGNTDGKKLGARVRSMSVVKTFEELEVRKGSESIPKARNQSPIRRLSFTMGKLIKSAGSRDDSPLRRPISEDCAARSVCERAIASTSTDNYCTANSNNNPKGRSSPLRRLLDPFLKNRESNINDPSKKQSSPPVGTRKSCNKQVDCCSSVKVKPRSSVGNTSITYDPIRNLKNKSSSSLQALLQVTLKNGVPLFTFAIDNETDILAATARKSSFPEKNSDDWTYTFFTVRETKRKSGIWADKSDIHGYVPNVVAQMKVSDSPESSLSKYENVEFHITREFNLFAVDVGHEDPFATDFHPTNELAAIIVKLPIMLSQKYSKDDQLNYNWLDLSHSSFTETVQERSSDKDFHRGLNFSTTIILPGGVHTIPGKGEISTLVQRWSSGGLCDCGGWDLGCQLLVYNNKRECEGKTASSGSCSSENTFQLFSQAGQDTQPVLSLTRFKERIYSVEFNSSLSVLQAFSVCMSFLDSRRPSRLLESSNVDEKITDEVGVFDIPTKMKTQVNGPVRYVSFPPHATVERV